jgi:hypothetical protein
MPYKTVQDRGPNRAGWGLLIVRVLHFRLGGINMPRSPLLGKPLLRFRASSWQFLLCNGVFYIRVTTFVLWSDQQLQDHRDFNLEMPTAPFCGVWMTINLPGRKNKLFFIQLFLDQLPRPLKHHIQLTNHSKKSSSIYKKKICKKKDDHVVYFKSFDI